MIAWTERRTSEYREVFLDRVRALFLSARGARLGHRSRVGRGCVVRRPWRLETGTLVQLEHAVYIKATGDEARIVRGSNVFVGCGSQFDISDSLSIGDGILIAPGCFITDHNHLHGRHDTVAAQGCVVSRVSIGDDVWLGIRAVIPPGVTIGSGAVVAAGAVVTRDVAPMAIVAGVPARLIGQRS